MPIQELHIDFSTKKDTIHINGRREILSKTIEGNWATVFKGRGMEFTGYRTYTFSDDASLIDWKASLRSKDILVREFEEFKNFKVMFFLDVSDTMLFTSSELFKAEYAAEIVYHLSNSAAKSGDAIGLAMFSDKIQSIIPASFGKGIRIRFEKNLSNKNFYGGVKNFKRSILELNSMLEDRSIIIIVSDFLDLPNDWEKYLSLLATRNQLVGVMIKDVRDRKLPKNGQFFLKDPQTGATQYIDVHDYKKAYEEEALSHEQHIRSVFKKFKSDCILIENESDSTDALKRFFAMQGGMI